MHSPVGVGGCDMGAQNMVEMEKVQAGHIVEVMQAPIEADQRVDLWVVHPAN